jgi:signal recognition particle GTPase
VREEKFPHLVTIFGPAGVGKSTVVSSFASAVNGDGAHVVRGRALPYRESGAYGALSTQVMRLCGTFESDPPGSSPRSSTDAPAPCCPRTRPTASPGTWA